MIRFTRTNTSRAGTRSVLQPPLIRDGRNSLNQCFTTTTKSELSCACHHDPVNGERVRVAPAAICSERAIAHNPMFCRRQEAPQKRMLLVRVSSFFASFRRANEVIEQVALPLLGAFVNENHQNSSLKRLVLSSRRIREASPTLCNL